MYSIVDINKIRDLILFNIDNVENIILFGSYAKGTATQNSDLDFAIILNTEIDRKEKLRLLAKIRKLMAVSGYNVDILVKEKKVYLNEIELPTLSRTIQNEGKLIWKRNYFNKF